MINYYFIIFVSEARKKEIERPALFTSKQYRLKVERWRGKMHVDKMNMTSNAVCAAMMLRLLLMPPPMLSSPFSSHLSLSLFVEGHVFK